MFTGLIENLGRVVDFQLAESALLVLETTSFKSPVRLGDSIAVNGVCLTVVQLKNVEDRMQLQFEISPETLNRSNLRFLKSQDFLNLESAVRMGDPLGGHLVQGHVDQLGTVESLKPAGKFWEFEISCSSANQKFVVEKGSICIDGVSLTINALRVVDQKCHLSLTIIPETFRKTLFQFYTAGSKVNLEFDYFAKYIHQNLRRHDESSQHSRTD